MIASEVEARAFVTERCDVAAVERLDLLIANLVQENERQNLVASNSLECVWQRHIADSAQLLDLVPSGTGGVWMDLGTGAGFPGLVIAAMRPAQQIILVESRRKRVDWLVRMVDALGLAHCRVEGRRLELVPPVPVKVITARAFAALQKTIELARPFSTSGTLWLLPKGRSAEQEVAALSSEMRTVFHVERSVTNADAGIVVGRMP